MLYIYYDHPVFCEIAQELVNSFLSNDIQAILTSTVQEKNHLDLYIILGMNSFTSKIVPHNYIVYQFEQTGNPDSTWFNKYYMNHLKNALAVWDYSSVNCQNLLNDGIKNIQYVPIEYMTTMKKITQKPIHEKDIDIFFYGSINQRRLDIIQQLQNKGLNVVYRYNIWNDERDELISRSKIILNMHYYQKGILETARLSYLLSNDCFVVSETSVDNHLDDYHKPYVAFSNYDNLVQTCVKYIENYDLTLPFMQQIFNYKQKHFHLQIKYDEIKLLYPHLIEITHKTLSHDNNTNIDVMKNTLPINSDDLFEAEYEITDDKQLILKLPKYTYEDLPNVSIITLTHNRKHIFPIAIRNWELSQYPKDKLEWIIIDDSDNDDTLTDILPKSKQIKYYKLQTTGRLSIGQKRNFAIQKSTTDFIVFMDDDDYYYPLSVYARIALLLKYPQYDLVGVSNLDIYDVVNDFSAKINGPHISEASMAFRKKFWEEKQFSDNFHSLGEGYPFLQGRRHQIIKMPSCFNLLAITHWQNYTQSNRSHQKFPHVEKKSSILRILDIETRLFIYDLYDPKKNSHLLSNENSTSSPS